MPKALTERSSRGRRQQTRRGQEVLSADMVHGLAWRSKERDARVGMTRSIYKQSGLTFLS